jgi:protein TonB
MQQVKTVRETVVQAAPPMFVELIAAASPVVPAPTLTPTLSPEVPKATPKTPPTRIPTSARTPTTRRIAVASALAPSGHPVADSVPQAPPSSPEPEHEPPKNIPASAVQYLTPPLLDYPSASRRAGETGRVIVRVYIDEDGLPRQTQLHQTSGFARLDDAALAAVQKTRFRPYTENGHPTAGWALIPLSFDLEP